MKKISIAGIAAAILLSGTLPSKAESLGGLVKDGYEIKAAGAVGNIVHLYLQRTTSAFRCEPSGCYRIN